MQISNSRYAFTISRLDTPELCQKFSLPSIGGRRESRVRAAPAVSCANCTSKSAHEHTGPAEASDFPCAVVFRLIRDLPGDRAFLPPSSLRNLFLKNLTPASGCQNHTTSSVRGKHARLACRRVHRHPSRVRDVRETPL